MTLTQTLMPTSSYLPFGPLERRTRLSSNWSRIRTAVNAVITERRNTTMKSPAAVLEELLHQTVDEEWPTRHHSRYNSVKVLLTYWAESDEPSFSTGKAAEKLGNVFRRRYGFEVEEWLIPAIDQPQQFFKERLINCVQSHGQKNNLLILWYGGLAEISENGDGPSVWYGEKWGGRINSGLVPQILGSGKADVLTLYDCGYSLHGQSVSGCGIFEHLGASPSHSAASFGRAGSFTRSLIQILDRPEVAAYGISVLDIHRKLVNLAQSYRRSEVLGGDGGSAPSNSNMAARSWFTDCAPSWPVYCHLSACPPHSKRKSSSIVLSQLGYPLEVIPCDNSGQQLEIQIKLVLGKNELDVGKWSEWILGAPSEVEDVIFQVLPSA